MGAKGIDTTRFKIPTTSTDLILCILACFVPPGAVYAKRRLQPDFWWSILLWCILWFPGTLFAWYIIAKYPDNEGPLDYHSGGWFKPAELKNRFKNRTAGAEASSNAGSSQGLTRPSSVRSGREGTDAAAAQAPAA